MKTQNLDERQITELIMFARNSKSTGKECRKAQAILMLHENSAPETIRRLTGYSKRHVFALRKQYLNFGLAAIQEKRKEGRSLLKKAEREEIINILNTSTPLDHGYENNFWGAAILADLIEKKYNVKYKSKKPYYILFKESKYSFRKPEKVYERRSQEEIDVWIKEHTATIQKALDDVETVVLTEDEMILSSQTTTQHVWLPKNHEPAKIQIATKRKNRSIYGFLNIKTGADHAFVTEWQNMYITVEILKKVQLIYPNKKLFIIWDGAGWHRGSEIAKFIAESNGMIETLILPAASPDLNPQEHVWKAGRSNITHNKFIPNIDLAAEQFVNFLNNNTFEYKLLNFSAKMKS